MSSENTGARIGVSADNHEAFIVITTAIGVIWTLLVLAIRLYLRTRLNGPVGIDDCAAIFGTIIGVTQSALTVYAVHCGIGKKEDLLTSDQINRGLKTLYATSILYIVATCSAKCSMSLLIARLTRTKHHLVAAHFVTGFTVIWSIASVFIIAFQCSLPEPWNISVHSRCSSLFARWVVIETFSLFIEFLILVCSMSLVWNLFVPFKTKLSVVGAFSMQLLVIVPTSFRLLFINRHASSTDPTFDATNVVITTQVVMHFSLMAATFPCMRKFLQAFDLNMGATTKMDTGADGTYGSGNGSYHLKSVDSAVDPVRQPKPKRGPTAQFRPELNNKTVTTITTRNPLNTGIHSTQAPSESRSIESDGSDKAIIRKTQQWDVQYEQAI